MSGRAGSTPGGARILDRLRDEGRISAAQYESVYHQAKRTGERIEEALLETGTLSEADLLKYVAGLYRTRFVSTERLAKADIDRRTLDILPRRVAEHLRCVPVLHDRRTQTISVVAYDLEEDIAKQVQVATSIPHVRVFVGRPAAVEAAVRYFYAGDRGAFDRIAGPPASYAASLDVFDRGHSSGGGIGDAGARAGALDLDIDFRTPNVQLPGANVLGIEGQRAPATPKHVAPLPPSPPASDALVIEMPKMAPTGIEPETYLATIKVLVGILDASREELRGHSAEVARVCERVADRAGVSAGEKAAVVLAAHLHDVGKVTAYHLTALNVSRFEGHRTQAQKSYLAPVRLFEGVRIPEGTVSILTHLYERYDGQGFPDRQEGKEIPWGSRLLAMVETYADLVGNPKNPYRRKLRPGEAVDVCRQLGGSLFDPVLADLLKKVIRGTVKKPGTAQRVLLVDADPEETTFLEMRLADAGYDVAVARTPRDAIELVEKESFHLVLSEVEFAGGDDPFALAAAVRKKEEGSIAFLTRSSDRQSVAKGFEAGAVDYLIKPVPGELVIAKVTQILEGTTRKRGGLAGSLRDVSLPDVIQALANGRKTGVLRITASGKSGEIQFLDGAIANAAFAGAQREDAIYSMLALADGDFSLDPSFKPSSRVIQASTEALLLEGMRRIDEGL